MGYPPPRTGDPMESSLSIPSDPEMEKERPGDSKLAVLLKLCTG